MTITNLSMNLPNNGGRSADLNPTKEKIATLSLTTVIIRTKPRTPKIQRWSRMSERTANTVWGRCLTTAMPKIAIINLSPKRRSAWATMSSSLEEPLEQERLHQKLIATARSLKKQKPRLKTAEDTLNDRWNEVLDTEEKYVCNRQTKGYPKRKLLPEFDDKAIAPIPPTNNTANKPNRPPHGRDKVATNGVHKPAPSP